MRLLKIVEIELVIKARHRQDIAPVLVRMIEVLENGNIEYEYKTKHYDGDNTEENTAAHDAEAG